MCYVSVIIPIYNGEKYIKKCLNSICNQTLRNIEIICVNDGSTDNSLSILNTYASRDNRIKIISTENYGQGHARNIALNVANGEFIAFVDADDWIAKDSLEVLYHNAKSNNLDLLFFQLINYIDSSNEFIESNLYNHQCFEDNQIYEGIIFNHFSTKDFLFEIPVCPVSKFFNKKFLDDNDLRFPERMVFEDNSFFYKSYFKCRTAGFLKKHLYYRRRHKDSVTQTFDDKKFDIVKAANEVLNVFIKNNQYSKYKYEVINHSFSMVIEWFKKSPLELKQSFHDFIRKNFMGFNKLNVDFTNNLSPNFLLIHRLIADNPYYLDFLSEYKLSVAKYMIIDNGEKYKLNTDEYHAYKSDKQGVYKITIIIPIYNNEKFIHRTLMSIENQTIGLENIEVLMVNDSSNDNTYDVINEYANSYNGFKSIHIEKGTGSPGTPRNIGLKEASAEYVLFLDHDDLLEINALEVLHDLIIKYDCDFVYGTYSSIDGNIPTKIIYPNEYSGFFKNISENERSIAFPPPSIWTKLFNRGFLLKNNILFPTILGEDAIFVSKALINAKNIYYSWDSLICYHVLNNKSFTNNISFRYLTEGFVSEEYMYNYYKGINQEHYYKLRGEGILDFYLSQFMKSNLTKEELIKIFPLLYDFVKRIQLFDLEPHVESNALLFNLILEKDVDSIINLKHLKKKKHSNKSKLKRNIVRSFNKIKKIFL